MRHPRPLAAVLAALSLARLPAGAAEPPARDSTSAETRTAPAGHRAGEEPPAPAPDDVVATVNGRPITRGELVTELLIRHGRAVLEDLIRQRAVEQEMARANIAVTAREVDAEIERERRAFATQGKTLEDMVADKYGMSMEGYREIMRRWLLIRKLIVRRERPTDEEVMLWFYRVREDRYDEPTEVELRHIFIAREDPRTGKRRAEAEISRTVRRVREGLVEGESFPALARRYSDDLATREKGGELGTVNTRAARLHLEPAFVEAMLALRPGQSGGPVETRKGFHFIQVTGRREGREAEYEDMRALVRADYLEHRAEVLKDVFLRDLMERTEVTRSFEPPERAPRAPAAPAENVPLLE